MDKSQEFENLIKNMKDSIVISGLDGKLKYVSPQYSELIGREVTIGESFGKSMHPDDLKRVTVLFAQALKQGSAIESGEVEYRVKHKDGHYIWIATTTSNYYDEDGNIIGFLTTARDISARKNTQKKLKESEEKYRGLFETSRDAIMTLEPPEWNFTSGNPATLKIFKIKDEEDFYSRAPWQYSPERQPDGQISKIKANKMIEKAMKEGSNFFEWTHMNLNGELFPATVLLSRMEIGDKVFLQATIRDITESKNTEQKLRESEKKYRLITEGIKDVIWVMDMNFKFKYISPAIKELRGFTVEEAMNQTMKDMFPPESLKVVTKLIKEEFVPKKIKNKIYNPIWKKELEQYCKDGSTVFVEIKMNLIRDDKGKPYEIMGLSRDITDRKKSERKIIESEKNYRKAYKQANFYKDLFVHDISNIFNALYGYSQLYSDYQEEMEGLYEQDEMMKNMNRHVFRGVNLIKDVQKLSKLDNSIIPKKKVNMSEVLRTAIENTLNSFPKKEIEVEFDSSSKKIIIQANELLLDVFENILNNAVKYNKNSPVEILIKINEVQENDEKYVKIEFLDNGIGIMDELKQYTFKKGYKTEMKSKGMGFGLSIVKKILKSYNGQIWVENKVEGDYTQGSNFVLLIPESS